jgi:hypothetical protein
VQLRALHQRARGEASRDSWAKGSKERVYVLMEQYWVRSRVEHVLGVIKRLWGFDKVRYRGLAKNATRSFVALGLANIYLARGALCE